METAKFKPIKKRGIYTLPDKTSTNLKPAAQNLQVPNKKLNEDKNINIRLDVYWNCKLCTTGCSIYAIHV